MLLYGKKVKQWVFQKLLSSMIIEINGKCFNIIYSFYKDIKSNVFTNEGTSNYFSSNVGVTQGENLSSFLFSIFLNDLERDFRANGVSGHYGNDSVFVR